MRRNAREKGSARSRERRNVAGKCVQTTSIIGHSCRTCTCVTRHRGAERVEAFSTASTLASAAAIKHDTSEASHHFARQQQASLCGAAPTRPMQRFDDGRRIVGGDLQQRERGTVWHPAPLLPIPERRDADADHEREFRLRLAEIGAHRFHIGRLERART